MRCSACDSELKAYLAGKDLVIAWVIGWAVLVVTVGSLPTLWRWALGIPISIAWFEAAGRIRDLLWLRRHPTRCQGGGHVMPDTA